ncbi:alkaline phosphatase family protein [Candidatus Zixiibacteriota bacterium]
MAFLKFGRKKRRVFVLSIDGVPHSFLKSQMDQGRFPHLAGLAGEGAFSRMRSVYPTISSVAWSSFMTGKNPAKHGIFGFVDHRPNSYDAFIPTSLNMTSKTLWEILSEAGKKVVVINVPVTYPPRAVNGILVSGFLASSLKKATYPAEVSGQLEKMGYRIDADAAIARESLDRFLEDLHLTLEKRVQALHHFMDHQPWDYFHMHIMGTDRINHFMWEHMEQGHARYAPAFLKYYDRIDEIIGELTGKLGDEVTFVLMSDHGFCTVKKEVNLNRYLIDQKLLQFDQHPPGGLGDIDSRSRAYALIPGRVYINLKGREPKGGVDPSDYERVRDEVAAALLDLRLPETGQQVIEKVFKREEIYRGDNLPAAADLMAIPFDGYDLKADVRKENLSEKTALVGMHTYDDASLFIRGQSSIRENVEIIDLLPTILSLMDVPVPEDVDGRVAV